MLDTVIENDYCLVTLTTKPELRDPNALRPQERVTSESLLGSRKELVIMHNGREYRLRLTQNGKLILTA